MIWAELHRDSWLIEGTEVDSHGEFMLFDGVSMLFWDVEFHYGEQQQAFDGEMQQRAPGVQSTTIRSKQS